MCEDLFSDENYQLELNLYNIRKELIAMLEGCEESLCTVCLNLKCSCNKDRNEKDNKIVNETTFEENDADDDDDDGWLVQGAKDVDSDVQEKEEDEEEEDEEDEDEDEEEDEEDEDEDEEFDDVNQNDSIAPPASSLPKPKWDSPKKEGSSSSTPELLPKSKWDSPKKGGSSSSTPEREPVHPDVGAWMEASRAEPIILQNLHYIDTQKKSQNIQTNGNGVDEFFKYFKMSNDTAVTYMSTKLAAACSTPVGKHYTYF